MSWRTYEWYLWWCLCVEEKILRGWWRSSSRNRCHENNMLKNGEATPLRLMSVSVILFGSWGCIISTLIEEDHHRYVNDREREREDVQLSESVFKGNDMIHIYRHFVCHLMIPIRQVFWSEIVSVVKIQTFEPQCYTLLCRFILFSQNEPYKQQHMNEMWSKKKVFRRW